jgi:DNA-binding Lrp family transcriptional regulator
LKVITVRKYLRALLLLRVEPMRNVFELGEALRKVPQVERVYEVTGEFELFVEILAGSPTDLGAIVNRISLIPGVKLVQIFVVTKAVKG